MQQRYTCIASKHETTSGHSPSDSHCSTHKRSTLACANDTRFTRRAFPPAPARRACPCHLPGESCLRRDARKIWLRRRSLDQSRSSLFSSHSFPLFCGANLSSHASLSNLTYRRRGFRRQKYEDPLDTGRSSPSWGGDNHRGKGVLTL